mgnify:CR=1 FL=1
MLAFIAWGIYLCSNVVPTPPTTARTIPADTVAAPPHTDTAFTYTEPPVLETKNISPRSLLPKRLTLPMPFDAGKALRMLIPGHYYHMPIEWTRHDSAHLVEWTCRQCHQTEYEGWGETSIFPLSENETTLESVQQVTDAEGRNNYFLSLGTTEKVFPDPTCGRFACGYLGLAWFRQQGNVYDLVAWSPCVGCFGAFQHVPSVHVVLLSPNNYGLYAENANGGAGGPYYGSMHLFGAQNGSFVPMLQIPDTYRGNTATGWTATLETAGANKLLLKITGDYNKYDYEEEGGINEVSQSLIPNEIKQYAQQTDSFSFVIERKYWYNGHKYHISGTNTQVKNDML